MSGATGTTWYAVRVNRIAVAVLVGFLGVAAGVVLIPRLEHRVGDTERGPMAPGAVSATASTSMTSEEAPPEAAADPTDLGPVIDDTVTEEDAAAPVGSGTPALGPRAPKSVTFGVVFVAYAGAQAAPRNARSKVEAEALANELLALARKDFGKAVRKGDPGSTEDAGKIYREILEPPLEKALFSLKPGAVGGPYDTPRGYWIVRRIK